MQGKIRKDGVSGGRIDEELYKVDADEEEVVIDNCAEIKQNLAATQSFKLEEEPTYQEVMDRFMKVYGTADNFMQSYGGTV